MTKPPLQQICPRSRQTSPLSRRGFLKLYGLGSLALASACAPKPPTPEIVSLPAELEMPGGSKFRVETKPPKFPLRLNRTLTQNLLNEMVTKSTPEIKVVIYSDDWIRPGPGGEIIAIDNTRYQTLSANERTAYNDGWTFTRYDEQSGSPDLIAVCLAVGGYYKKAIEGKNILMQNEFIPKGIVVHPFIAMNALFIHEIVGHALLRNTDYRDLDKASDKLEESEAQKIEIEWVNKLMSLDQEAKVITNDQLFLIPS